MLFIKTSLNRLTPPMQTAIPAYLMRGGTSRGPFFLESDLPVDIATRDKVLLAIMGSPDKRQIDGLGGANSLTSKVGIVRKSSTKGVDLDFLFAQVFVDKALVDTAPNCGNMLAAVVPFAIERGIFRPNSEITTLRVLTLNTDMQCDVTVHTPNGQVNYDGDAAIDGVPGTCAPITINFLDTAGSVCSSLLPTGRVLDHIVVSGIGIDPHRIEPFSIDVTCIDNGMPMVLMRASDLQRTALETVDQLNADINLKQRIEAIRLLAGQLMGLGDVREKSYPKMCMVAAPSSGGSVTTRCFIPHTCHDAIGVLAAVTVATACVLDGSVCTGLAQIETGFVKQVSVEHPSGEFSVELTTDPANPQNVTRAALLRTARLLMRGDAMIPATIWTGRSHDY